MRIAALQLAPDYTQPIDARREQAAGLVRAQAGADLVVLPELWPQGGFLYTRWAEQAEAVDGPTVEAISAAAKQIGAWVHAGSLIERDEEGRLHNTSVLLRPDGSVAATYRKIHLFGFSEGEPALLVAGVSPVTVDTDLGRLGLATCYDLRFPELFRALVDAGAECVVIPAAWPASRVEHWSVLARARAIENQYVVVAVNATGEQGTDRMAGGSAVIDARGTVVTAAGAEPTVLTAEVDLADVRVWREQFPALADRRL
ncbi:MAG TPA: carbon-nitrogen family hydrolase [Actinomycetes bacterium]|nr:carbon-nitrogen family hydrolase [Actinomycetes bacterium]